ncbi:type 4a pilus biogenesis protein PilO [Candidatus Gracilibacteria bacterium]|nr:type 4a pilus biogenesis protein PilO [Candidatus Gracilibacteria bacterium]
MYSEKKIQPSFVAGLVLFATLIVLLFHTSPARSDHSDLASRVDALQEEINTITASSGSNETSQVLSEIEEQELASKIPDTLQQEALINDINRLAKTSQVTFNALTFSLQKNAGVPSISISAGFQGPYENLIRFLKYVEQNPRLFIVQNASVSRTVTAAGLELVNLNITMHSFYRTRDL